MASISSVAKPKWFECGVFKYFKFTPEVIEEFTIDEKMTLLAQREKRRELGTKLVSGSCKYCPTHKPYNSQDRFSNPSNWVRHLENKHEALFNEYKNRNKKEDESQKTKNSAKRGRSPSFFPEANAAKKQRQETLHETCDAENMKKKKEKHEKKKRLEPDVQERINYRVLDYIVAEARPLITVESETFQDILKEIDDRVQIFSVKTLKKTIVKEFKKFKSELEIKFKEAACVCLTADIWSAKNRSFLGVTAHWLVTIDACITRKSAAIAIRRFTGMML